MTRANGKMSKVYLELFNEFVPRIPKNEAEYDGLVEQLNWLIDKGQLSPDEHDYMMLIAVLIQAYDDIHYPHSMFDLRGSELICQLLQERGLRQKDLVPIFKTESIVSAVLHGKRQMTAEHLTKLSAFFQLPIEAFVA